MPLPRFEYGRRNGNDEVLIKETYFFLFSLDFKKQLIIENHPTNWNMTAGMEKAYLCTKQVVICSSFKRRALQ